MKKITKLKDLPTEQRLRIEIILDRNRHKPTKESLPNMGNDLIKEPKHELLNKIRQVLSNPKYSKLFNKN